MTDDKADDRVTISRETLQWALDALCELSGPGDLDVCDDLRAALAAQPVEPVEPVATSYADHQQRIGAPLTFFTSVAAQAYRAAATRDDVTHEDAMRVALQAVQGAAPPAPAAVPMTEEVLNIHKPYYSNIEWPCFKAGVRFAEMVHGTAATTCHVPPGWKLVPIEPTEAMIASGAVALVKASHSDIDPTMEEVTAAYRAMIAAGDKP